MYNYYLIGTKMAFGLWDKSQKTSSQPATPSLDIQSHASSGPRTIIAQHYVVGQMTTSNTGCNNVMDVNVPPHIDSAQSKAYKGAVVSENQSPRTSSEPEKPSQDIQGHASSRATTAIDAELRVLQSINHQSYINTRVQFINHQSYINTRDELATTFKAANLSPTALKVFPQIAENSQFYDGDHAVEDIGEDSIQVAEYVKDRKFCFQSNSDDISRSYEDVLKMIEAVNAEEVTQVILLVAQAGAGKTVGMKRWARSIIERSKITSSGSFAPDSQFQLVLFKSFKSIQHKESTNLQEILFGGCCENSNDAELIYKWAVKNDSKVSIFIDGLDQTPWTMEEKHVEVDLETFSHTASTETVIGNLLSRKLLPGATIVISSREFKAAALPYQARPGKVLTLLGFSESDAQQLFDDLVLSDEEKQQSRENPVIDDLKSPWEKLSTDAPLLTGFLTIPVFLMLAAIVYLSTKASMPVNVTGLFARLLRLFLDSSHVKQALKTRNVIHKLKKVAHKGMVKGSLLFKIEDLLKCNVDPTEVTDLTFKVPGKTELSQRFFEEDYLYFFFHPSIQEFLSACFIVEMNLENFKNFVLQNFHQSHWSVTRHFIFGIIFTLDDGELVQITNRPEKQEILLEMLKHDLDRIQHGHEFLEMFYSLYESRQDDFIRRHVQNIELRYIPLGNSQIKLISYIMQQCRELRNVDLSGCNWIHNLVNLLMSDLQDRIKINELHLEANKLSFAILNSFLDKLDVNRLLWHHDDISGSGKLSWKNVSHLHIQVTTSHSLEIEKEKDLNQILFSIDIRNLFIKKPSLVKGSMKKNEIMTFRCHETDELTDAYIIYCLTAVEKYLSPRSVTSEATKDFSSQYVKYEFLERTLLWNVNLTISEIVLDCMEVAYISSSLVESFTRKYQVKVLNIAVPIDHRDATKHWMISPTVVKLHICHAVKSSSELHEMVVSLETVKVKNLRIYVRCILPKDDLAFLIKNCNLKNVTICMPLIDENIPKPLQQELQEVATSVHVQLEFVEAFRYYEGGNDPWCYLNDKGAFNLWKCIQTSVGKSGSIIECGGCTVIFPAGALDQNPNVSVSASIDSSGCPKDREVITPYFTVQVENLKRPATVRLKTWCCIEQDSDNYKVIEVLRSFGQEEFQVIESQIRLTSQFIEFECDHFCKLVGTVKRGSKVRYRIFPVLYFPGEYFVVALLKCPQLEEQECEEIVKKRYGSYRRDDYPCDDVICKKRKTIKCKFITEGRAIKFLPEMYSFDVKDILDTVRPSMQPFKCEIDKYDKIDIVYFNINHKKEKIYEVPMKTGPPQQGLEAEERPASCKSQNEKSTTVKVVNEINVENKTKRAQNYIKNGGTISTSSSNGKTSINFCSEGKPTNAEGPGSKIVSSSKSNNVNF